MTPTLINAGALWLCQIPLAYSLSVSLTLGPRGVFIALLIPESVLALVTIIVFRRGWWKKSQI